MYEIEKMKPVYQEIQQPFELQPQKNQVGNNYMREPIIDLDLYKKEEEGQPNYGNNQEGIERYKRMRPLLEGATLYGSNNAPVPNSREVNNSYSRNGGGIADLISSIPEGKSASLEISHSELRISRTSYNIKIGDN